MAASRKQYRIYNAIDNDKSGPQFSPGAAAYSIFRVPNKTEKQSKQQQV